MYSERFIVEIKDKEPVEIDFYYLGFERLDVKLFYKLKDVYHPSYMKIGYWNPTGKWYQINPDYPPVLNSSFEDDILTPRNTILINEFYNEAKSKGLLKDIGESRFKILLVELQKFNNEMNTYGNRFILYEGMVKPNLALDRRLKIQIGELNK